MNSFVC